MPSTVDLILLYLSCVHYSIYFIVLCFTYVIPNMRNYYIVYVVCYFMI